MISKYFVDDSFNYDISEINNFEEKYAANSFNGIAGESINYIEGKSKILLSAPHSVNQYRNSKIKMAERYTGAIAEIIQKITKCHIITKTYNNGVDDNYILKTEYKDKIGEILSNNHIVFVLDLHGMLSSTDKGYRGYDIEIGTDNKKNLLYNPEILDIAIKAFNENGIYNIKTDYFFKASKPYTISKYISSNFNTPSMQLEISSNYRNPNFNIKNFNNLIKSIVNLLYIVNFND